MLRPSYISTPFQDWSESKNIWSAAKPMNCEETMLAQAQKMHAINPNNKVRECRCVARRVLRKHRLCGAHRELARHSWTALPPLCCCGCCCCPNLRCLCATGGSPGLPTLSWVDKLINFPPFPPQVWVYRCDRLACKALACGLNCLRTKVYSPGGRVSDYPPPIRRSISSNSIKALPWFTSVREKLEDKAYWPWFLAKKGCNPLPGVYTCGPDVTSNLYHVRACRAGSRTPTSNLHP